MITFLRRQGWMTWISAICLGGGGALLVIMASGLLGSRAQEFTCWLARGGCGIRLDRSQEGYTGTSGPATPAVGVRNKGLVASLERAGALNAAHTVSQMSQIYETMSSHGRNVLGLPPAGPTAVAHAVVSSPAAPAASSAPAAQWGARETSLYEAMEERRASLHASRSTESPAPAGGMKLRPDAMFEL